MGMKNFEVAECEDSLSGLVDVHHLYVCVDRALESVPGSQGDIIYRDAGHLKHVEAVCGTIQSTIIVNSTIYDCMK